MKRLAVHAMACLMLALPAAPARAQGIEINVAHYGTGFWSAPWAVAQAKGYFKEAGVDVKGFIAAPGGGTTVRNMLASDFRYGEVSIAAAYQAWRQGADLVMVNGTWAGQRDQFFVVRKDSELKTIKDLVGKKVAITNPKGGADMFLRLSLAKAGIPADRVNIVAAGGLREALQLLASKNVDASISVEPVWTVRKMDQQYKVLFNVSEYVPPLAGLAGIAEREFATRNRAVLEKVLAARARAVEFIYANPKEAASIIAKEFNLPEEAMQAIMPGLVGDKMWLAGRINPERYVNFLEAMKIVGAMPEAEKFDLSKFVDPSYLPAGQR